ncbi:hypothetical protein ACROYT_G027359 [Oculina patagonica]
MNVPWSFRVLLAVVTFTVSSQGTVEIEKRLRLITPPDDIGGGRVEIYHNGQWGTICDKNWEKEAAKVVCKELGYSGAIFATKRAFFGEGNATAPIHLSNVKCDGSEHSILECTNDGWGEVGSCTHKNDAGVRCIKDDIPELKYLGCWIDNPVSGRILQDFYANHRGGINWHNLMDYVLRCAKDALDPAINKGKDYNLFAVQYYAECYSQEGNPDYKKMKAAPDGCVGGVGELSHNAVYGFGNYSNLGCWKDEPGNGRTMTLLKSFRNKKYGKLPWHDLSIIVNRCYNLAKDAGRTYFAVQFYGERQTATRGLGEAGRTTCTKCASKVSRDENTPR